MIHNFLVALRGWQPDHGGRHWGQWVSTLRSRSQRLIRMLRMPAETNLAFGWTTKSQFVFRFN